MFSKISKVGCTVLPTKFKIQDVQILYTVRTVCEKHQCMYTDKIVKPDQALFHSRLSLAPIDDEFVWRRSIV